MKFTLLELLLTMAVIAILAGVLLPVLNSSRMKAQAASCFSNLKQIGVAAAGYSQNFEDYWCPDDRFRRFEDESGDLPCGEK